MAQTMIYVSSTYADLVEHRRAVAKAMRRMRKNVLVMEDYVASDERPLERCLKDVEDSDIYVGIFAWRYGFIPPHDNPERRSITELEFRHAVKHQKPCLIFLLDKDQAWSPRWTDHVRGEGEQGARIQRLREEMKANRHVSFFKTAEELATLVSNAVTLLEEEKKVQLEKAAKSQAKPRDATADDLSQTLKKACREKTLLKSQGQDTSHLDTTINSLKQRMRQGAQLRQGDFLADGFELLEELGRGGFAQVWKAYDEKRDKAVAVKVLHPQYARDKTRRDRFFRGARYMAKLDHSGIVKVVEDELEDGGFYFFTMDHVGGGDFRQAVLSGRLSLEECLQIILDIGEALQYAHGEGVIHRDVKPANILLDLEGRPKLTDFDLVRAVDTTGGTRTSSMLGTFLYAAPEAMIDASQATASADVYGLGMTALFALHGADLPPDVLWELPDFLAALEVDEGCRTVVSKAVARKVEQRFATVGEFCEALQRALEPRPRVDGDEQGSEPPQETGSEAEPSEQTPSGERASTIAQRSKLGTVLATLKQTKKLDERAKIFEGIPDQLGEAGACLALVEQLKDGLRNGFDLFWLWWIVEEAERRWRLGNRAQEVHDRFFAHIPEPPAELFQWIETPRDGRVELWREIPAGEGWIGAADGEENLERERPRHRVEILQPFAMAAVSVTKKQYAAFDPVHTSYTKGASHPLDSVTWYEAVSFCRWLATLPGFAGTRPRLPVEEEWEYACRAGTQARYWSGDGEDDLKRVGWYDNSSGHRPHRVGEKPANPWGLYDVHGNVWEWTASPWDAKRYQGRENGVHAVDPAVPAADLAASPRARRVLRGGGCWSSAQGCRSAFRYFWDPWVVFGFRGFRVLLSSVPSRPSKVDPRS